ncbi:MAG TPA: hypothetical protein VK456_02785 [Xanthobacteraceae bacterium]|nr:hypothetical protein [Xanthobacteraceae bacterium]
MKAESAKVWIDHAGGLGAVLCGLVFLANAAAAYVAFAPLAFGMPEYGLDPSWRAVLGEAPVHGWRFGRDIIFNGGPLSAVYTQWFEPDYFGRYLAANAVLIATFALLVAVAAWRNRRIGTGFLVALGTLLCVFTIRDAIFVAYPLLVAVVVLAPKRGVVEDIAAALGVFCAALFTLVKFLIAPAAVVTFVLCDGASLIRRRWPVCTIGYVLLCFGLFAWLEGPGSFPQYIFDSIDVAAGYSAARALGGSNLELAVFVIAAAVLLATLGWAEARSTSQGYAIPSIAVARWLVTAAYVFLMFKEGFVRHDSHSLQGWSGLAVAALLPPLSLRAAGMLLSSLWFAIAVLASAIAIPLVNTGSLSPLADIVPRIEQQLVLASDFLADPDRQIAQWRLEKQQAWARVRAAQDIPRVDGSVDVIPSIQSSLLAYGLDYRPRYSFQGDATYTRRLIAANRRSLIEYGPDFLLFAPAPIDDWFPALSEGALWPDILRGYAPVSDDGKLLLLRRRPDPLANLLGPAVSRTVSFSDAIAIPDGPQFLRVTIKKTPLGGLVELLFRPGIVWMTVGFSDGTIRGYRVVPAMAEAGFLISPWIASARDFLLLAEGRVALLSSIKWIGFETSGFGRYVYAPQMEISISPLALDVLQRAAGNSPDTAAAETGKQNSSKRD